jgi:chitinase
MNSTLAISLLSTLPTPVRLHLAVQSYYIAPLLPKVSLSTQKSHDPYRLIVDIKTCQSKGKKILLSLGGAAGSYGFDSEDEATTFAQTLYDMFGEGTHKYRPFDDAVVDGFDFDIEGGGSCGYGTLSRALKSLSDGGLLITGAPQCPFPDSMLGDALNEGEFDAVFVQFYNNYCSPSGNKFNFDTWDHWAKNRGVKVLLGLPGSPTAAGSGYIPFDRIQKVVAEVEQYDSYGGVMFWGKP